MDKLALIITPAPTGIELPTLDRLIKKATPQSIQSIRGIFNYFAPQLAHTLPIAALTGLAHGLDTRKGYWLRADPVDLRTDINSAYFFGQQSLALDLKAAQALVDAINPLLVEQQAELFAPDPYCWYLKLAKATQINTPHPNTLLGASIRDYLTEAEPQIRRLFTEIQMLLAGLSKETQKIGQRPVTGLWFWGGGEFPQLGQLNYENVYSDEPLAKGLAIASGIPHHSASSFRLSSSFLSRQGKQESNTQNTLLVIAPEADIEQEYLVPIYQLLKKKQIAELTLYLGGDVVYHITPKQLRNWWNLI